MEPPDPKKMSTEDDKRPAQSKEVEALVVHMLIKSGLFLQRELNQVYQQHGLNTNQFSAINEIIRQGPISQKELCERLLFEKSNVSKIVKNLLDKAFISVSVAPNDRRSTLLIETEQGSEIWKKCLDKFHDSSTELMSILSDEELRSTLQLMKRLERRFIRLAEK
jgi:DNA-binding MarR family transcriptional regulator